MYYLTIAQLNTLMPTLFTSKQLLAINWSSFTDGDKTVYIEQSDSFLDSLRYRGNYKQEEQTHAFPRILPSGLEVLETDERIKRAACSIVYDLAKSDNLGSMRTDLISQGVKSISTGGVSESYGEQKDIKPISDNYIKHLNFCIFKGVL